MANDLATLNTKLATALRDEAYGTWDSTELDDLITWAVADLYPRFARPLDPETTTVTLVADTYFYDLPSGVKEVSAVELYNGTDEYGALDGLSWSVVGDAYGGTGKIRIVPQIAQSAYTVRLYGWGIYDTATNLIPDTLVPLVIANARAEALRRVADDRSKFEQWLAQNQKQNVTVNELLQMVGGAESAAVRLDSRLQRTWRLPVPGRRP